MIVLARIEFRAAWVVMAAGALASLASACAGMARAQGPPPQPTILPNGMHPAVVRVMAADRDGLSLGSGTLVAVSEHHGLVVTNWHVVRDAAGPILVAFPNGFRSPAAALRTDPNWDLAALAIWRPNVDPVPLASLPPQPGEPLTIAGYGSGQYRTITGRCTQYVSPGLNQPFEMVELSAPARQGDSGGPIFNSRGELAGVLFGTAGGQTAGSYCGRVRAFLTSVREDFFRLQPHPALLAQSAPANPVPAAKPPTPATAAKQPPLPPPRNHPPTPTAVASRPAAGSTTVAPPAAIRVGDGAWTSASPGPTTDLKAASASPGPTCEPLADGSIFGSDIRNYLAVIGVAAIAYHALKFLTAGSFSRRRRRRYY